MTLRVRPVWRGLAVTGALLVAVTASSTTHAEDTPEVVWFQSFGTSSGTSFGFDTVFAVVAHVTGVYVAGRTEGSFPRQEYAGGQDAFLRRYDFDGSEMWTRQFGTEGEDIALDIAADSTGVYLAGSTEGDAFVRKYDFVGTELWMSQFGTSDGDLTYAVTTGPSGVYAAGRLRHSYGPEADSDAFVKRYDSDGNAIWARQLGTAPVEFARAVAVDGSGVYVGGSGFGFPGFLTKYDSNGKEIWTRVLDDRTVVDMVASDGNLYVVGDASDDSQSATCSFHDSLEPPSFLRASEVRPNRIRAPWEHAMLEKYDAVGRLVWTCVVEVLSAGHAVAVDSTGVFVTGTTPETFPSQMSKGGLDAFVRKYDFNGNVKWTRQFGTEWADTAFGISAGSDGVYVGGDVWGAPGGSALVVDAFIAKIAVDVDEPVGAPSLLYLSIAALVLIPSLVVWFLIRGRRRVDSSVRSGSWR